MEILNKYDIPCGPILSMKEIAEDRSPLFGEHTVEVLKQLVYTQDQIEDLHAERVV